MIEKLIENWLDKSVERTFQIPFCYMLVEKGSKIIHMTRHCGMELGKDVIAISPDEVPCAYQLKTAPGGRITLAQWNGGINNQVFNLVVNPIGTTSPIADAGPNEAVRDDGDGWYDYQLDGTGSSNDVVSWL